MMRAGVLWMLMLRLSDGKDPTCSVLTSLAVSKLTKVNISCPSTTRRETNYQLFFNGSSFGRIDMKKESGPADMLFSGQFEVTANSSGEFLCRSEESWPPPNTDDCHTTEVVVAELQSLPEINGSAPAANQSCPFRSPLIPEEVIWAGCGVLLVYSLSITCIAIALWKNMRRSEEGSNDYMNARPGEFRKPG
ncbi:hypothetical protein CgunFtcFv8_024337 [Champsocephalus gunnari]|uniref:Uncharacterized protein n=2 Tax=Champsocephalus gunnari TaxID=52237 RepID=A0AAN8HL72_CHAGU|nr:hypothetical protein CgunFtcFv8_024337 [Champsocephalus gunnari]